MLYQKPTLLVTSNTPSTVLGRFEQRSDGVCASTAVSERRIHTLVPRQAGLGGARLIYCQDIHSLSNWHTFARRSRDRFHI